MKTINIIRGRGHLTIPDSIRKAMPWVAPLSAVSVMVVGPNEISIRPPAPNVSWNDLWTNISQVAGA